MCMGQSGLLFPRLVDVDLQAFHAAGRILLELRCSPHKEALQKHNETAHTA